MAHLGIDTRFLVDSGHEKGFTVEEGKDYGAGPIDVVWKINIHPALPEMKCGFIALRAEEGGGSRDTEDNQFSLRKTEEAIMRGLRSGMDKVYLVAENDEQAKSLSGRVEWLASHGSCSGWTPYRLGCLPSSKGRALSRRAKTGCRGAKSSASKICATARPNLTNTIGPRTRRTTLQEKQCASRR